MLLTKPELGSYTLSAIIFAILVLAFLPTHISASEGDKNLLDVESLNDYLIGQNIDATSDLDVSKLSLDILDKCGRNDECVIYNLRFLSEKISQEQLLAVSNNMVSHWEADDFYCHETAHHIGEFLFGYFNGNLSQGFSHVDGKCGNALYHGMTENYFPLMQLLNGVKMEDVDITLPCANLESTTSSYVKSQCVHGISHGLLKAYNFDIFNTINRCDEFITKDEQFECKSGVFMENGIQFFKNGRGDFDQNDLFYPCNKVDLRFQSTCYGVQASYILKQTGFSPTETFDHCESLELDELVRSCYNGAATYMANYYFYDVKKTVEMCKNANEPYRSDCVLGAVFSITMYVKPELGYDFCIMQDSDYIFQCFDHWETIQLRHI